MRRTLPLILIAALLGGCVSAAERRERERPLAANPSAIIAAELAFNRLAQEKGAQSAFRETAHRDAVMFVPQRVKAQEWLRSNSPGAGVTWQPHAVYASCDGSAGATTGAWQHPAGIHGYFTTVWLRERNGDFRWVLDHAVQLNGPRREAPEFIDGRQARCGSRPPVAIMPGIEGEDLAVGLSADQTLSWRSLVRPDGSRQITIKMWDGSAMQTVIDDDVTAAAARGK